MRTFLGIIVLVSLCASAQADVFNMPSGQTSLSFVPVGNPGNPSDPATVGDFGGVGYSYNIGKFEVTIGQYTKFLNAVAATDTYGLYQSSMATFANIAGIARSGSAGSFTYTAIGSSNRPIAYVDWGDTVRFANWLTNGQPTGMQNLTTTEDGSYFINGATSDGALALVERKPNARFVLPTENEWYKAAYYDPTPGAGGGDNYWLFPMKSNSFPYSDQSPGADAPNAAIAANYWRDDGLANGYNDGWAVTASPDYDPSTNYLTDAGAYNLASSFYGTFDQGGNLAEWNEAVPNAVFRYYRGGSYAHGADTMWAHGGSALLPASETEKLGFRIAEVPEPTSVALLGVGSLLLLRKRARFIRQLPILNLTRNAPLH
jgi:sulfatase-modifying factor enzyme 1